MEETSVLPPTVYKISAPIIISIGILLCFFVIAAAPFGAFIGLPATLNYHITERYSLTTTDQDTTIHLGILVPKSGPYQKIENMSVSWEGKQERESSPCVDVIKLSGPVKAGTSQDAVIEYDVSLSYGLVVWRAQPDGCQLLPQCMIESDHPDIVEQANQITDGNSWWDAYKIYSFTDNYLVASGNYLDCVGNMSALEAYQSGRGMCGEFSRLMVALSRASEIPSLVASGILLPDMNPFTAPETRTRDHPGVAHAWVEFADRDIWTIADPAWGANAWDLLYFGRNDGRHLSYGCINHEGEVYAQAHQWASQIGPVIGEEFAALKFAAAADVENTMITPTVTVRKGWDGRWLNAVLALAASTFLLCYIRNRLLGTFYEDQ